MTAPENEKQRPLVLVVDDEYDVREVLSEAGVSYQSLVSTIDTVRGFRTVVATNAVEVELFPDISLGDAPTKRSRS